MSWDKIRAAYPPDTWLLLEVDQSGRTLEWQYYEPIRVLEVLALDSDPLSLFQKHFATCEMDRMVIATTADTIVAEPVVGYDSFEPDGRFTAQCLLDLRPPRDRCGAGNSRDRHGGCDDHSERN